MATIPTNDMFTFADMLGITLEQLKTKVGGEGRVYIPISEHTNIVCKLNVVAHYHHNDTKISMLCVHVRGDLYVVLIAMGDTGLLYALDANKTHQSMPDIFKHLRNPDKIVDRFMEAVVMQYQYQKATGWRVSSVG